LSKKKEPDKKATVHKSEPVNQPEPNYSRSELIEAASFGVKPEVIAGALRLAGKESMTKAEAERAIKRFLQRRVK
jgi:hypothetical protein